MSELRQQFLDAMARVAQSVTVVTTAGVAGRTGLTVSAMTSVSAEPPLLLVCINRKGNHADVIAQNQCFAVNVLDENAAFISDLFAGYRTADYPDPFACNPWATLPSGSPSLEEALVRFDCTVSQHFDVGSHRVFIGAVNQVLVNDGQPLLYYQRGYRSIHRDA